MTTEVFDEIKNDDVFMGYDSFQEAMKDYEYTSQAEALAYMLARENVFISGPPGSGKSAVVKKFIELTKEQYGDTVNIAITGTTGYVASMLGGRTVHSWSGIGVKTHVPSFPSEALIETDILIIDEISMLPAYYLDLIDETCKKYKRKRKEPFGGIQVIFLGDFMQLQPVRDRNLPKDLEQRFVVHSNAWKESNIKHCYLDKIHRSKDPKLTKVLSDIENGTITQETVNLVKARSIKRVKPDPNKVYTRLYTVNKKVDEINENELAKNPNPVKRYARSILRKGGTNKEQEDAIKSVSAPEELYIKEGAKVMISKNNHYSTVSPGKYSINGGKFVPNGSVGKVEKILSASESGKLGYRFSVIVKLNSGELILVAPAVDHIVNYKASGKTPDGKIITQAVPIIDVEYMPLKLAYAITVHKSQGQTLDGVIVDLSQCFSAGMGYVALSRVRSLDDLIVEKLDKKAFMVNTDSQKIAKKMKDDIKSYHNDMDEEDREILETVLTMPFARYAFWDEKLKV